MDRETSKCYLHAAMFVQGNTKRLQKVSWGYVVFRVNLSSRTQFDAIVT